MDKVKYILFSLFIGLHIVYCFINPVFATLLLTAFPIMCFFTNFPLAIMDLLGKNSEKKQEAKHLLIIGIFGGIAGYLIGLLYFYLTRDEPFLSIMNLACMSALMGAGYTTIAFSCLPKKLRLKGMIEEL